MEKSWCFHWGMAIAIGDRFPPWPEPGSEKLCGFGQFITARLVGGDPADISDLLIEF